jgi:class 3 adenylate cyclase/outer membrane protein assembly factor BamB
MPERRIATVLMLDIVGSTQVAAQLGDARYRELSSRFNRMVREALKRHGGREEDHAGDGFFATFAQPDRAIRCAATLTEAVRALGIEIRCGIHTGQTQDQAGKTHGIAVVIGARVMSLAGAGEVLVTSTTKELVTGSDFGFEDLSAHELKGVPGTWQVFAVTSVGGQERARPLPAAEAAERLAAIRSSDEREPPRPGPKVLVAGALALLVTIAAVAFAASRGDENPPPRAGSTAPQPGSVVAMNLETGERTTIFVASGSDIFGRQPPISNHGLVVGQGGVWALRFTTLFHIDALREEVRRSIFISSLTFTTNVAQGLEAIWVVNDVGLYRVNPATDEHRLLEPFPPLGTVTADVAVGAGHVWVGTSTGWLLRLEPRGGERREVNLDPINSITVGHGSVWTIDSLHGTVTRWDPETMRPLEVIPISVDVDALASGDRHVWVLSRNVGSLVRIDVNRGEVAQTARVGDSPTAIAAGLGAVWVGDEDGVLRRVDESTLQVTEIPFGATIRAIAVDEETETLWIDVA